MSKAGSMIRKKRKALGLTLDDLSSALGFGKVFLYDIESGKRNLPPKYAKRLSKLLEFRLWDLKEAMWDDLTSNSRTK